jgi:hypothetical protein
LPSLDEFIDDLGDAGTVFAEEFPWEKISAGVIGAWGAALDAFDFTGVSREFAASFTTSLANIKWEGHLKPMGDAAGKVIEDKDWTGVFGNSKMGKAIEDVFNDAKWSDIFSTVATALSEALGTPEFRELISKLIIAVGKALDDVNWTEKFTKAGEYFGAAIKAMPWDEIFDEVSQALKDAIAEIDVDSWEDALANLGAAMGKVIENIPKSTWVKTFETMGSAFGIAIENAWNDFAAWLDPFNEDRYYTDSEGRRHYYKKGGLVPNTGPAFLHAGEMVLPADITRGLMGLLGGVTAPGVGRVILPARGEQAAAGANNAYVTISDVNVASSYDVHSMMDEIERRLKARALAY